MQPPARVTSAGIHLCPSTFLAQLRMPADCMAVWSIVSFLLSEDSAKDSPSALHLTQIQVRSFVSASQTAQRTILRRSPAHGIRSSQNFGCQHSFLERIANPRVSPHYSLGSMCVALCIKSASHLDIVDIVMLNHLLNKYASSQPSTARSPK